MPINATAKPRIWATPRGDRHQSNPAAAAPLARVRAGRDPGRASSAPATPPRMLPAS